MSQWLTNEDSNAVLITVPNCLELNNTETDEYLHTLRYNTRLTKVIKILLVTVQEAEKKLRRLTPSEVHSMYKVRVHPANSGMKMWLNPTGRDYSVKWKGITVSVQIMHYSTILDIYNEICYCYQHIESEHLVAMRLNSTIDTLVDTVINNIKNKGE